MHDLVAAVRDWIVGTVNFRELLDLQAQLEMAFWAKWMFWATIASLLLSLIAVVGAFLSLRASLKAATESREVGEYQTQGYVHASGGQFGKNGNILIRCKNGGLTPVTHFCVNGTAQIVQQGQVSASISFENEDFKIWSALGAGEELPVSILDNSPIVFQFINQPDSSKILLISGQILYCTIFNHDHVTQFSFFVEPGTNRFRRPTANLVTFHRIGKRVREPQTVQIRLDDNEGASH